MSQTQEQDAQPLQIDVEELKGRTGQSLGFSPWRVITQDQVDGFAEATGDHQWIHTDPERAKSGPFGGTIAHGFMTLSLFPALLDEVLSVGGAGLVVNYGANRVRFPAPVPVGAKVRGGIELAAVGEAAGRLSGAAAGMAARALGAKPKPELLPAPKDRRFRDPAWDENPWFFGERQAYLAWAHLVHELVTAGGLDKRSEDKAAFALGLLVDAMAPTNFLMTNPAALRKAAETHGMSVVRGLKNFVDDVVHHGGWPRQVDASSFEVGRNLAATPGKVVFRNDLMELIQYEPQAKTVYEIPLLVSPPWINKYYLMDLAPGRSFIEWAEQHGHTVFAISYRNPDESMRDVSLDDYLIHGPRAALDVIADITGSQVVNMAGLCIGGTLTTMLLAYLAAGGEHRVNSTTLLNTLVDFSDPGALRAFTDAESSRKLEQQVSSTGFLDAADMEHTFNSLRANDLVWNYVASNWL